MGSLREALWPMQRYWLHRGGNPLSLGRREPPLSWRRRLAYYFKARTWSRGENGLGQQCSGRHTPEALLRAYASDAATSSEPLLEKVPHHLDRHQLDVTVCEGAIDGFIVRAMARHVIRATDGAVAALVALE